MESVDWQNCTNSKCPSLTACIFGCDDDNCLLACIKEFKEQHVDCPCEVDFIFFRDKHVINLFQVNCPHGCPCDNYDCDGEDDPDLIVGDEIQIKRNQVIGEIPTYGLNHSFEFEIKSNRATQAGGHCGQVLVGCIIRIRNK